MPRGGLTLVAPDLAYLPAYKAALETGWSANTTRDTSKQELSKIALGPDRFIGDFTWRPGQLIVLEDGTQVERLPGFTRWIWDGGFCGSINIRHLPGTDELPPHVSGHVGYSVVPWKRRQGCASFALRAILPLGAEMGLGRLMVTCDPDNVGSRAVIEKCGGSPVEPLDPRAEKFRYWVQTSI